MVAVCTRLIDITNCDRINTSDRRLPLYSMNVIVEKLAHVVADVNIQSQELAAMKTELKNSKAALQKLSVQRGEADSCEIYSKNKSS